MSNRLSCVLFHALLLLLFFLHCVTAQAERIAMARFLQSNQTSKRDAGSASRFIGPVYLVHIFVSDDESAWTDADRQQVWERLSKSYSFLEQQSRRHGREVRFVDEAVIDYRYSGRVPLDTFANPEWTETVIRTAKGKSGNQWIAQVRSEKQLQHVLFCLHIKKAALSYNLAYYDHVPAKYRAERMVCFKDYPDGRPTSAATYAHEILHVFGAGDLYFPYDHVDVRKQLAREIFPDDVMLRVDYDLSHLEIGRFTAYRVGWVDSLDNDLRVFED